MDTALLDQPNREDCIEELGGHPYKARCSLSPPCSGHRAWSKVWTIEMAHSIPEYHAEAVNDGGYTSVVLGMDPLTYFPLNEAHGPVMQEMRGQGGQVYSGTVGFQNANMVRGESSKGPLFDGIASYGHLTSMGNFGQNFGSGVSVSFFYCSTDTSPGDMLGSRAPSAMTLRLLINVGSVSGLVKVFLRDNASLTLFGNHTDATINDGDVHHVFVSANPSANIIVYRLDGVSKTITYETQDTPATFVNLPNPVHVGGANLDGSAARWMNSCYGHLAFWNRVLSIDEATALYKGAA